MSDVRVGSAPEISVVVCIVDGGDTLRRFLRALTTQTESPALQILVPWDNTIPAVAEQIAEFPQVTFVPMGHIELVRPAETASGQHELYDKRRAAGLLRAEAPLVAILEDRAPPRANWATTMRRLHAQHPYGVIGGAIQPDAADLLNWSFWACDFSRYGLPFESGPREWVSDVNVCYKRRVLDTARDIWESRYNEVRLHWTLMERGETLYLSNEPVVEYRTPYRSLSGVLPERFHWGRLFGCVRAQHVALGARLRMILTGPLIPFVLLARHIRTQLRLGNGARVLRAAPIMLSLLIAWSAGEVWGYITREP